MEGASGEAGVTRLIVAPNPCSSCPYVRSTPPGVWDPTEYVKLAGYDADPCLLPVFRCHETRGGDPAVCKGWLVVHRDSVSVRLGILTGQLSASDRPHEPDPTLYESGTEACIEGMRGVKRPSRKAREVVAKIHFRRSRKK